MANLIVKNFAETLNLAATRMISVDPRVDYGADSDADDLYGATVRAFTDSGITKDDLENLHTVKDVIMTALASAHEVDAKQLAASSNKRDFLIFKKVPQTARVMLGLIEVIICQVTVDSHMIQFA